MTDTNNHRDSHERHITPEMEMCYVRVDQVRRAVEQVENLQNWMQAYQRSQEAKPAVPIYQPATAPAQLSSTPDITPTNSQVDTIRHNIQEIYDAA